MGSLGSSFFLGWVITSIILTRYSDKYGRKNVVFFSTVVATIATIGLVFSKSLTTSCILLFIIGLMASGVFMVSNTYNMEMLTP